MRIALIVALVIVAVVLIVSVMLQPSKTNGFAGIMSGGSDTFYSKNKSRTREAVLARVTAVSAFFFAAIVIALNLLK